jgi:uncharacterized protein (TIGR02145 family)
MKRSVILFLIGMILVSSCKKDETTSTPSEIKIGSQTWKTQNLNVSSFRNGDLIPEVKSNFEWRMAGKSKKPVWCYSENHASNKLYNWYAATDPRGLAPEGWHIPSINEIQLLIDNLGGQNSAGNKLKSKSDWKDNGNGTNESGFNGFPSGMRDEEGIFTYSGVYGYWWSLYEFNQSEVSFLYLSHTGSSAIFLTEKKECGLSIRCVKD